VTKRSKSKAKAVPQKNEATIATPTVEVVESVVSMPMPIPPEIAFREAEAETDRNLLRQYIDSIHLLREKGFSYREIAEWLTERGLSVDHNEVYREYMDYCEGRDGGPDLKHEEIERQMEEGQR
jgi:hypothetical protein